MLSAFTIEIKSCPSFSQCDIYIAHQYVIKCWNWQFNWMDWKIKQHMRFRFFFQKISRSIREMISKVCLHRLTTVQSRNWTWNSFSRAFIYEYFILLLFLFRQFHLIYEFNERLENLNDCICVCFSLEKYLILWHPVRISSLS